MNAINVEGPGPVSQQSGAKGRRAYRVATVWGAGVGASAFGVTFLVALPMRPSDPSGIEELGWYVWTLLFAAAAALVGGSVGTWCGLTRAGFASPVMTALLVVPAAVVLGAPTAGVCALAAPAVAVWLTRRVGGASQDGSGSAVIRRVVTSLLVAFVLAGCGAGAELAALQHEKLSDLSRTDVADAVREEHRFDNDAGTALGKPVYASTAVTYAVTGDPQVTFDRVRRIAVEDGWAMDEPRDGMSGPITSGEKPIAGYRGDAWIALIPEGDSLPSGAAGPLIRVHLRLMP